MFLSVERPQWSSCSFCGYGACWRCLCCYNPLNSDMECSIFHVRTDVNACDCTEGCMDTKRESALKVDSGKKSLAAPGNWTCASGLMVRCSTTWVTSHPHVFCLLCFKHFSVQNENLLTSSRKTSCNNHTTQPYQFLKLVDFCAKSFARVLFCCSLMISLAQSPPSLSFFN